MHIINLNKTSIYGLTLHFETRTIYQDNSWYGLGRLGSETPLLSSKNLSTSYNTPPAENQRITAHNSTSPSSRRWKITVLCFHSGTAGREARSGAHTVLYKLESCPCVAHKFEMGERFGRAGSMLKSCVMLYTQLTSLIGVCIFFIIIPSIITVMLSMATSGCQQACWSG